MSAFMVEDSTINKVVSKLAYGINGEFKLRQFKEVGYDLSEREGRQQLGWDMFSLNIRSVNQRYDDHPADSFRPLNYKFVVLDNCRKIDVLKGLRCWLYQSCEGDCMESNLYKMMDKLAGDWAYDIVSEMPEYEQANWG